MSDGAQAALPLMAWLSSFGTVYLVIALAEIGDKSQLVCMTLAARHRPLPIIAGAISAFCLLNLLAVVFGAAIAAWLPGWLISTVVAVLFAVFGIQNLRHKEKDADEVIAEKSDRSTFGSTFLLIFMAEFGDKTQLAVAGLSSTVAPTAVWSGATLALTTTSILGVMVGTKLLKWLPLRWIHRASGMLFLVMAAFAAFHAVSG